MNSMKKTVAQKTAMCGVLIALAMVLSYIEVLLPLNFGVPGIKPGLANLVVFLALCQMGAWTAFLVSVTRVILAGITFGSLSSMIYSMTGAVASFLVMYFAKKKDLLPETGVSIAGGISHNLAQLAVAALVLENAAVFAYLPVLLLSGMATGALIGILGVLLRKKIFAQIGK